MTDDVVKVNVHHEILVDDADEAKAFFEEVLGATEVQHEFAHMVELGWDVKNHHMALAGRVYQLLSRSE
ncbi:MAG: hypothetical protein LBG60_16385, partial [Bifidobacteriaceae bacterium]|nr:hypothetical protein [Bifidobacteriaceae bacterium]